MGRRSEQAPPKYSRHRTKKGDQACYYLNGRHYLGVYGSPESYEAHEAIVREWRKTHAVTIRPAAAKGSLAEAVQHFLNDVKPPRYSLHEWKDIERDLGYVLARYGQMPPDSFRLLHLKQVRQTWVDEGGSRKSINRRVGRIRRFFRWAANHELCEPTTCAALGLLTPLAKGEAPGTPPVLPVPLRDFAATLRHLPERIAAMARLQYYCGCRPEEICRMEGRHIHKGPKATWEGATLRVPAGVWLFIPPRHKRDKDEGAPLVYYLGPRCQAILTPWLRDVADEPIFSAAEAYAEVISRKRAGRKSKVQPSQADRSKRYPMVKPGAAYQRASYYRVIQRTCEAHGIPPWAPNRLRHNFVTRMDELTGGDLVATSEAVGHKHADTTRIYLQRVIARAAKIAAQGG